MSSPRRSLLILLFTLWQSSAANSQASQINNKCSDNGIRLKVCQQDDDAIPLPNPFETCEDGEWTGSKCFPANNIATGNIRFSDSRSSDPEANILNQSEPKNEVGIPQLTEKEWIVDLEKFHFVYSIVIYHYIAQQKDARRVGVVVETGLQLNSHDKSITFNHKCEQSTAGVGKKFTFYCFDPQGMHHMDETVPGIFSRNVRVSIKNKLNQRISISKITIFENQGVTCGRPAQIQNGTYWPVKETYAVGSRVDYQCNNTTENDKKQIESRTCRPNGSWTKTEQSSSNNTITTNNKCMFQGTYGCPDPDAPSNGAVQFTIIRDKFPKAEFICNDGYKLSTSGTFRTTCYLSTGVSTCQRAYCPYPDEISDTFWVLKNSTTFQGSLVDYYSLEGSNYIRTMECNNDGKWSQTLLISNEDHNNVPPSSLAFVRENYWVVVVPFVVLCIVASLCVSYQEKIRSWMKNKFENRSNSSASSSFDDGNLKDYMDEVDDDIVMAFRNPAPENQLSASRDNVYERISLYVPDPPEELDNKDKLQLTYSNPADAVIPPYATVQKSGKQSESGPEEDPRISVQAETLLVL